MSDSMDELVKSILEMPVPLDLSVVFTFCPRPPDGNELLELGDELRVKYFNAVLKDGFMQLEGSGLKQKSPYLLNEETKEYLYTFLVPFLYESDPDTPKAEKISESGGLSGGPFRLHADPSFPFIVSFTRSLIELTSSVSQDIAENKFTLDIFTDFATIIGVTVPVVSTVMRLLHLDKASHNREATPSVTISIGEVSVTVTDEDLDEAEHAATNIARKLLREHPEAKLSTKVQIQGKLIEPPAQSTPPATPQVQLVSSPPQRKPRKKRSKKSF